MVYAEPDGSILDHPSLLMAASGGGDPRPPRDDEIVELPRGSDLFLLPDRTPIGLDPDTGEPTTFEREGCNAVAGFLAPAWTLFLHPTYRTLEDAPTLPLFAYAAVGFADDRFWATGIRVDEDARQDPWRFDADRLQKQVARRVDVDGDNASAYAENAESYRNRLDELDESFRSTLEGASKDVVFVAGHNAFQYLGQRYDFEVRTLTGLSPDDQPTPRDIERAQEIIAEHDLQYVCADPLESQTAANQLVAETDATEVLPLTPIPGQTQEWADEGWGYIEIMENINLETLKQALDAE